jgi:16S rRNA (cytidine1402-2'-O)-methyltransferase
VEVLRHVDRIACEDTRHSRPLLDRYGINRPLLSLHEHNEEPASQGIVALLLQGESLALISDAGTPLINDPGYPLVRMAHQAGIRVTPIPGPCALIAALAASGLPSNRFAFEGFPPRKSAQRQAFFRALVNERRTLIFYESSHRITQTLGDIALIFPADRRLTVAKELTKQYETLVYSTAGSALEVFEQNEELKLGEFVVLIEGSSESATDELDSKSIEVLTLLLEETSLKTAVNLAAKITQSKKDLLYQEALRLKGQC